MYYENLNNNSLINRKYIDISVNESNLYNKLNIKVKYCSDPYITKYSIEILRNFKEFPWYGSTKIGNSVSIPLEYLGEQIIVKLFQPFKEGLLYKDHILMNIEDKRYTKQYYY